MLTQIRLRNFKSFAEVDVPLGRFTLLVGRNASGKSNLLDAMRFLQGMALGLPLVEVLEGQSEGPRLARPALRGGAKAIIRAGAGSTDTCDVQVDVSCDPFRIAGFPAPLYRAEYSLSCTVGESAWVRDEGFVLLDEAGGQYPVIADAKRGGPDAYDDTETPHVMTGPPPQFAVLSRFAAALPGHLRDAFFEPLVSMAFCEPDTALMRNYVSRRAATQVGLQGQNLSAVLHRLVSDDERGDELLGWVQELCGDEIARIEFAEAEPDQVMLKVVERSGATVYASSLSDGTLRFLSLVATLLTAPRGSVCVLEEVETGLHPTRLHLLTQFIESVTEAREIQVVATTHSPFLLDYLQEQSVGSVVVFSRSDEYEGTKATRLVNISGFDEARKVAALDLLIAEGWPEKML